MRELAWALLGIVLFGFGVLLFLNTAMPTSPDPVTHMFQFLPAEPLVRLAISAGAITLGVPCFKPLAKMAG